MPTSTVEDYLKTLLLEQQQRGAELVLMGRLAAEMRVTPGTATAMVKALAESGLVDYEPRGGVRLTHEGERLALHVLRRHRLVELFLVEVLGLDWAEVHDEADQLEHAISEKVLERIDTLLGHPAADPHGDPIPTAKGKMRHGPRQSLVECEIGQRMRIARVIDQDPRFLQFMDRHNLRPGAELIVAEREAVADAVSIQPLGRETPLTIGRAAAEKILVEPVETAGENAGPD